ncbi:hypothetical protein [Sphingomonas sp. S2-65]|uniref:hypothetical protein n=1 Tax=Sphingomonas sp. S2-65 TaxID=2903960 RepID=UPI001F3B0644|nr:hypothetical protein [Sphingomonas sp. S2-65]UYY57030.1 hypothetical protein LZ586_10060 [Sphingomonas sp. S2-65]
MPHVQIFLLLLLASLSYAFWRGGAPERTTAAIFIAGAVGSALAASPAAARWANVELGVLAVDAAMLIAFLALMIKANRLWPILLMGLQTVQVAGHLLRMLDPKLFPFLYWVTSAFWSYAMVVLLVIATFLHSARLRHRGHDAPWSSSSGPSSTPARETSPGI